MDKYKIYTGNKEFDASEYQIDIFKHIESGIGNLIINASAGSSKTTSIINSLRFISEKKKILFVAFNKDIVEKISNEIDLKNVNVSTFHSLGFSFLNENGLIKNDSLNQELYKINIYKYNNYIYNNINIITRFKETKSLGKKYNQYISNIKKMIDYARYYLAFTIKEISKVGELYGIIPVRDEYEVVRNILIWGKENIDTIDYTDMIWLPNVLNLTSKKNTFDWIFIDEAQDTSIVEQKLIEKCFKRSTRFVAVGDEYQQINVWCGATEEAINNFKKYPNTKELNLPISYRCPKKIVELARKYSNNIIANYDAIEGEINYNVSQYEPKINDMVLCRTTAPLIDLYLDYLRHNKKAFIRGFENIKETYINLITYCDCKLVDKNCVTSDGLIPKLYQLLIEKIDKLQEINGLHKNDAIIHPSVLELYDNIEGLTVLSEGITTTDELTDKINVIFNGDSSESVQLSTVHKAKGLEADNVYILYPSLMPNKLATKDWEIKTENNLIYVAYTRSKKTLNFIKEDKYNNHVNGYFNIDAMVNKIDEIKKKIKYNKELGITEKNYDLTKSNTTIKLGENTGNTIQLDSKNQKNNKIKGGLKMKNLL